MAKTALAKAELDLSYTRVVAPKNGKIANLTLRQGSMVEAGAPLFALVETDEWWVKANFKETELARIHRGQPASIELDMYPGHSFHGEVQSINPASGTAFSLLPPENATGNWVKVTQRFPVKVMIKNPDAAHPLRVGASSQVVIDTSGTDAARETVDD